MSVLYFGENRLSLKNPGCFTVFIFYLCGTSKQQYNKRKIFLWENRDLSQSIVIEETKLWL